MNQFLSIRARKWRHLCVSMYLLKTKFKTLENSRLILLLLLSVVSTAFGQKPHVVVIYTDDMGIGDLSCYHGVYNTPNIDKMAKEGIQFTKYYSASPVCSPSRVAIMTGMHPARWQINTFLNNRKANKNCEQLDYLSKDAPTISKVLQQNGYITGHFGKWHMGGGRDVTDAPAIKEYGFDEWSSTWESPNPDPLLTSSDWIWANSDSIKRWNRTAYFVDKTLDFLRRHKDKPCFVNLWPDDVHTPWVPDEESPQKTHALEPNFKEVLKVYDEQIGRLMDGLNTLGIAKNTIVIFTSDNGPAPGFNHLRSLGLRGQKNSLYEGGIRMPFIVKWPNAIPQHKIDSTTVLVATDMFSTICGLVKVKIPSQYRLDGEDMSRALLGKPMKRKTDIYYDFGRNRFFNFPPETYDKSPSLAIRSGKWKLLMDIEGIQIELYDLSDDTFETKNVAEINQKVIERLKPKLLKWWGSLPQL